MTAARAAARRFAAGAAGVLTAHQALVWALHRAGVTPWAAYSLAPTRPLGVPAVASAAFWGGAWWAVLSPLAERAGPRATYWARAALLGAVPPTAVGALIVAAGRPLPRGGSAGAAALVAAGLAINAVWGLAAAAVVGLTRPRRPRPESAGAAPEPPRRSAPRRAAGSR